MAELNLELDHVGVAVGDLDMAHAVYGRLGFTLTPRSIHAGSHEPGGPVKPMGSGNHCAMFANGYLELIGITDASLPNHASAFLEKYQGIHIVALGLEDAAAAREVLKAREPGVQEISMLERDAAFGPDGQETRRARFANIYLDDGVFPEAYLIFIEHLTRDVLWQPHLMTHANGALAMQEVAFCVEDAADTSARLSALLGFEAKQQAPGIFAIELPRGRFYVMSAAGMGSWATGVEAPHMPYVAGFGVAVGDLGVTKALLARNGISYTAHPYPAIWVAPADTLGPVISFIQA